MKVLWIRRGVVVASAALALVLAPLAPTQADPGTAGSKDEGGAPAETIDAFAAMRAALGVDGMKNNSDLNAFKTWLLDQPDIYGQGFYESSVDIHARAMTLLWHGTSPLQSRALAEGARRGLTVTIRPVGYTRATITAAMKVLTEPANAGKFSGLRLVSLGGPTPTNDTLTVRLAPPLPTSKAAADAAASVGAAARTAATREAIDDSESSLAATVQHLTGLTATFEPATPITMYATSRSTDSSPYNSGGLIRSATNVPCTSGFAVISGGQTWVTTARHCDSTSFTAWDSGTHSYGGSLSADNSTAIRMLNSRGYYWMFNGTWSGTSRGSVSGLGDYSIDTQICISGGNSGTHCTGYLAVEATLDYINDGDGWFFAARAESTAGIVSTSGDSGAPVYVPASDGSHVLAIGTLQSGGANAVNCGPVHVATAFCSTTVYFSSFRAFLTNTGATLYTGP